MLDLIIQNMSVVWLVLMVLLFIIEAATAGLTVIWFALGALAALIAALFGAQAVFFAEPACDVAAAIASTAVFLVAFPKILKKRQSASDAVLPG